MSGILLEDIRGPVFGITGQLLETLSDVTNLVKTWTKRPARYVRQASRRHMIPQETLAETQPTQSSPDHAKNIASTQLPAPTTHDDKCCGGTCEVSWKPVKATSAVQG